MGRSTALPDSAQAPFIVGSCFFPFGVLIFLKNIVRVKELAAEKVNS